MKNSEFNLGKIPTAPESKLLPSINSLRHTQLFLHKNDCIIFHIPVPVIQLKTKLPLVVGSYKFPIFIIEEPLKKIRQLSLFYTFYYIAIE